MEETNLERHGVGGVLLALPVGMTKLTLERRSFTFKEAPTLSTVSGPTSSVLSCNA